MAIKVIKHGKEKKFTITCPDCECEFEYELCDLCIEPGICLTSYPPKYRRFVRCPECGKRIFHDFLCEDIPDFNNVMLTTQNINDTKNDPCETCPNRDGPKDAFGNPVVGDSPCQWCQHYKWRMTCTTKSPVDK